MLALAAHARVEGHFTVLWRTMLPFVRRLVRGRLSKAGTGTAIQRVRFAAAENATVLASAESVRGAVVSDASLVDDLVQEVGIALLRHLRDTPKGSRLYAHRSDAERWLTGTAKLVVRRGADRAARSLACAGQPADDSDTPKNDGAFAAPARTLDPEAALAEAEDARRLHAAVARLGARARRIVLAELEGQSREGTAAELGTTKENVRVILCRALAALGALLAPQPEAGLAASGRADAGRRHIERALYLTYVQRHASIVRSRYGPGCPMTRPCPRRSVRFSPGLHVGWRPYARFTKTSLELAEIGQG